MVFTEILYSDGDIAVCVKPAGLVSEAAEGGLPALIEAQTGKNAYTVHSLDAGVGGVMVYALNARAAAALSEQIRDGAFGKTYLAVLRGTPAEPCGTFTDFLYHDRKINKSFVVEKSRKGVKEAVLDYRLLACAETEAGALTLTEIRLRTGRTHQIRVQFASRRMPLYGDGKYGGRSAKTGIALFSHKISFLHPESGKRMEFSANPPNTVPWTLFGQI